MQGRSGSVVFYPDYLPLLTHASSRATQPGKALNESNGRYRYVLAENAITTFRSLVQLSSVQVQNLQARVVCK